MKKILFILCAALMMGCASVSNMSEYSGCVVIYKDNTFSGHYMLLDRTGDGFYSWVDVPKNVYENVEVGDTIR